MDRFIDLLSSKRGILLLLALVYKESVPEWVQTVLTTIQ